MGRKLFINNVSKIGAKAGNKAKSDINRILKKEGFCEINVNYRFHVPAVKNNLNALEAAIVLNKVKLGKDDLLCIQVPSWYGRMYDEYILGLHRKIKFKLMVIIHDIERLRQTERYNDEYCRVELSILKDADVLVCHNDTMKAYLSDQGISNDKIICLGIFDYMLDREVNADDDADMNEVIIAGNLSPKKSGYIYSLSAKNEEKIKYNMYGYGFEGVNSQPLKYCGCFPSDEIPYVISGRWGLVWDGTSSDAIEGVFGNYLRYNNQHKASLYLAAQKPIIIWKGAGLASFVEENKVGFCVDNLNEIPEKIASIDENEYQVLKKNVKKVSQRIIAGYYAEKAIKRAVDYLHDREAFC